MNGVSTKFQAPTNKQARITKIQNSKLHDFGHLKLEFVWDLEFGILDSSLEILISNIRRD
jgi:hypothetical protein